MTSHASMNRIYRLVFNAALGIWVAVAENAKGRGKGGRAASALIAVLAVLSPAAHAASAADATVVSGAGTVATAGLNTTINQTSQRLAIDWTQLSTAANESLTFNQPNAQAIALNRIIGSSPSNLLGSLTANGQVFILNPNGVLFGAGSQVNVGGLVASTLAMSNADFQSGSNIFSKTTGTGSVVNQGSMTAAPGGYLALLAPEVRNEGVMSASLGTALLAAGNKVTLNLNNGSLLGYSVDEGAIKALADNKHLILADGGQVLLSAKAADALSTAVVNNTGVIEATSLTIAGGKILLEGDLVVQNGTLDASGVSGGNININARAIIDGGTANASGTSGSGGNINYRATQAIVQSAAASLSANGATTGGTISLNSDNNLFTSGTLSATGQNGGTVDLLGNRVVLAAAKVDASGTANGGLIRVGGDFKGANPNIKNAQTTLVNGATTLKANGADGKVVVWSDSKTNFYGNIIATGNAIKGGEAEVSSKGTLTYGGNATLGKGGTLLLDPANIIIDETAGPAAFALQDPNAFEGKGFGENVTVLGTGLASSNSSGGDESSFASREGPGGSNSASTFVPNGKVVIAASNDNLGGAAAGAAYLFDTNTGALLSTLTGSQANDRVGNNGVTALANGNFVVRSGNWSGDKGAVTFGSSTAGVSGAVSASNSLVGSTQYDYVGNNGVTSFANGNYVVSSANWDGQKGAVTFGSGTTGVSGVVDSTNSLVGSNSGDYVGNNSITALTNGNYVVSSSNWGGQKGAVTFGSGTTGVSGVVDSTNSLVGSTSGDYVGGVTALTNGNYVVNSNSWGGGKGAVTFGSGTAGVKGVIDSINSLVGSTSGDRVGNGGVTALTNGNYVVSSPVWGVQKGAVTFGSGTAGVTGAVDNTNSLVGTTAGTPFNYYGYTYYYGGDLVGNNGITALANGNYVVNSASWGLNRGASTFVDGSTGVTGVVSASNSLVGTTPGRVQVYNYGFLYYSINGGDQVGDGGVTTLTNGNYVVGSSNWDGQKGAATFGSGTTGVKGVIDNTNSLVGSSQYDYIGGNVTALTNGNYVVRSSNWQNGKGAVTFGNGTTGMKGVVDSTNSLVGTNSDDNVGDNGVTVLTNGNYVVNSSNWDGGKGAATFGSGTTGVIGAVSASNSLVGSTSGDSGDYIGSDTTALANGNYVVSSSSWDGGKGAVTFGSGTTGVIGVVSASNSLVGSNTGDAVGNNGITALANGNYVVSSDDWDGQKGAVTFGSGTTGVTGVVSEVNSLVGSTPATSYAFLYPDNMTSYGGDRVGSAGVTELANGNYVVNSSNWDTQRGAVTVGSGTTGVQGVVSANNSLVGATAGTVSTQDYSYYVDYGYPGPYVQYSVSGGDRLGSNGVRALTGGNYLVTVPDIANGTGQVLVGLSGSIGFDTAQGQSLRMNPAGIAATLAGGTAVTLQAGNDITVNSNITVAGTTGGALTLQAGRNINLNSVITTANGSFTASAGDPAAFGPGREPGAAAINQAPGSAINAGTGVVTLLVDGLPVGASYSDSAGSAGSAAALQSVYQIAQLPINSDIKTANANPGIVQSPTAIVGCGMAMPASFDVAQCN